MQQGLQWPPPRLSLSHSVVTEVCHLCHHHYYLLTKVPSASWHSQVQPREPDVANLSREGFIQRSVWLLESPAGRRQARGHPARNNAPKWAAKQCGGTAPRFWAPAAAYAHPAAHARGLRGCPSHATTVTGSQTPQGCQERRLADHRRVWAHVTREAQDTGPGKAFSLLGRPGTGSRPTSAGPCDPGRALVR